MAGFGAALGLALAGGIADGYAKERQTQADYRRRMAELSYRSRLGQINRSMEQTKREQDAMFPPIWIGPHTDPKTKEYTPGRFIRKGDDDYDDVWQDRRDNPDRGGQPLPLPRNPTQTDPNQPVPPGHRVVPTPEGGAPGAGGEAFDITGILGGLLRQPDLPKNELYPRIDPDIVDAWMVEFEFDPDMADAVAAIRDRISTARKNRDKWQKDNKRKRYPYDITSVEQLREWLIQNSVGSPESSSFQDEGQMFEGIGMGGDVGGRGTGEPVRLDSGEVVLDTTLNQLDQNQLAARNAGMGQPNRGFA
tara:strand:- start:281 stop:1198 length:918 start_codon:yes stop_codon:yes gene_type:complete